MVPHTAARWQNHGGFTPLKAAATGGGDEEGRAAAAPAPVEIVGLCGIGIAVCPLPLPAIRPAVIATERVEDGAADDDARGGGE